jgi:hypothetical protein
MSTKKKAATVKETKPFSIEPTAAGKKDDLRMASQSIRTKLLAAIVKAGKIEVDALEKKFPDFTRANITGAVRYLIGKGYARKA